MGADVGHTTKVCLGIPYRHEPRGGSKSNSLACVGCVTASGSSCCLTCALPSRRAFLSILCLTYFLTSSSPHFSLSRGAASPPAHHNLEDGASCVVLGAVYADDELWVWTWLEHGTNMHYIKMIINVINDFKDRQLIIMSGMLLFTYQKQNTLLYRRN